MSGFRVGVLFAAGLAGLAVTSGCVTGDLNSPEYETSDWYETEVNGIDVLTNARPELAERSLRKLARFLVLARAVGGHTLPDEPLRLHLFAKTSQYNGFVGNTQTAGHSTAGPWGYYLALATDRPGFTTQTLFHEVVHLLLDETGDPWPSWYNEGYAEFLASAILRPGVATLGRALPNRVKTLRRTRSMGLATLFLTRSPWVPGQDPELFYAEAWAFQHFIHTSVDSHEREKKLKRFVELLLAGNKPAGAFATAFGQTIVRTQRLYLLHRARLAKGDDVLYRHYVISKEHAKEEELVFRPAPRERVARELADHALLIGRPDQALRHYDELLDADPTDADALLGRAMALATAGQFEEAEAAIGELDPRSPQAAEGLGRLLMLRYGALVEPTQPDETSRDGDEVEGAAPSPDPNSILVEARDQLLLSVARSPSCRRCWEGIARFHALHPDGDPKAGLDALTKAGRWVEQDTLKAELLFRDGRLEDAQTETERVLGTTHVAQTAKRARALLLRILQSRNRAWQPPAAPGPSDPAGVTNPSGR